VPAQHRVRLDDRQSLFPRWQLACKRQEQRPVVPGQGWSFQLPFQHNQLLAEQHVFLYQFLLAACQVDGGIQNQSMVAGLRALANTLFG
jgi:hypothetical protein